MPKALKKNSKLLFILLFSVISPTIIAGSWQKINDGIEYRDLSDDYLLKLSHIHVFKINLNNNHFSLAVANHTNTSESVVRNFAKNNHTLIALNGGFFDKSFRPLGLRISNQHQLSPIKRISWWGIFYIENKTAHITNINQFAKNQNIDFAVQSGPRLIIEGKIPSLKPGYAERSALGINKSGEVIIIVTENTPLTTTSLAKIMLEEPLNCENAINLDGGSSSQLYAKINKFKINVTGFSEISDAILIGPINP